MPHRRPIQNLPVKLPPGHKSVHKGDEAGIVRGLQEVVHFVDDDLFQAFPCFFTRSVLRRALPVAGEEVHRRGGSGHVAHPEAVAA